MHFDEYFVNGLDNFIILTVLVIIIYLIIWYSIEKKINKYNEMNPERTVSIPFVASAVRVSYFVIGFIIIGSQILPFRPALEVILDAGGVLAICVTFAARESFSNYIAGFLLTIHKPFIIGDRIRLQDPDITGTVNDITFRHTVIETDEGSIITIPNSIMNTVAIEDLPEIKPKKRGTKKTGKRSAKSNR